MERYYLISQLPSIDFIPEGAPLPITEERFYELCARFLGKRTSDALAALTLSPPRDGERVGIALIDAWNDGERGLRVALARVRAELRRKPFDIGDEVISPQLMSTARTAAGMTDPLEAERYLNGFRLGFLETLRPADMFSENAVFYFGLKLKLLNRMRLFDTERGRRAYQNKYSSILRGGEEVHE